MGKRVDGWRLTAEELPPERVQVLFGYRSNTMLYIGSWRYDIWRSHQEIVWHMEGYVLDAWNQPDYWMPLPQLPD